MTGKWRGILATLGLPDSALKDEHGPCPICGGKDRFRFDNKDGRGTYFCNQCGSGDGWKLLMEFRKWSFKEAANEVREVCGMVTADPMKTKISEENKREALRELWKSSVPISKGDIVDRYLTSRGIDDDSYPAALRTCERCWFANNDYRPPRS